MPISIMQTYTRPEVYCGDSAPPNYRVYKMFAFTLKTDMSLSRRGFRVSYQVENCGGEITKEGEIESTRDSSYTTMMGGIPAQHMNCAWNITAPPGHVVILQYDSFYFLSVLFWGSLIFYFC